MEYKDLVRDFIERTLKNLERIEEALGEEKNVYEVTQLINSLLGLIVLPKEKELNKIEDINLEDLESKGWPKLNINGNYGDENSLRGVIRHLRNAIAHFRVTLESKNGCLDSIIFEDNCKCKNTKFKCEMEIDSLKHFVKKFAEYMKTV